MMTQEEKEEIALIIQSTVKQVTHSMSPETRKEFSMTEKNISILTLRVKNIEENVKEIKKDIKDGFREHSEKLDNLLGNLDNRYASKSTEVAVSRVGWAVFLAVIAAVLGLVIKK